MFECDPTSNPPNYEYFKDGNVCDCNLCRGYPDGEDNYQGPEPLCDNSNVEIAFFAFGDSPYDKSKNSCFNKNTNTFEDSCSKSYNCGGTDPSTPETW